MTTNATGIRQHDKPEQAAPKGYKWACRVIELAGDDVRNFRSEWYLVSTVEAADQRAAEMVALIPEKIAAAKAAVTIANPESLTYSEAKTLLESAGCRNADGITQYAFRDGRTVTLSEIEMSISKNLIATAKAGR